VEARQAQGFLLFRVKGVLISSKICYIKGKMKEIFKKGEY